MSQGELKCCGSPLFLKSKYGSGYNMVLTRKLDNFEKDDTIAKEITSIILNIIPCSKLVSNVNSELGYILPSDQSIQFSRLFEILDQRKEELNILNVGISITTLEEVFLK